MAELDATDSGYCKHRAMGRFNRQCLLVTSICVIGLLGHSFISFFRSTDQFYISSVARQNQTALLQPQSQFAYAFIVSGCTEKSCLGYLLNAIAAKEVLSQVGSVADVVFMVRMAKNKKGEVFKLPVQHESWLKKSNIQLRYLPSVRKDNFGTATLEKFRTLELLEYDRVLFLDSDILPLRNLDYLFELSMQGKLSEYVAFQGAAAPITASTFLVTPRKGEFERIMNLVHQHRALNLTTFDEVTGWGHTIAENDRWFSFYRKGTTWKFYGVTMDQGIIFHWLKYMHGNFTFLLWNIIEEWRDVTNDVEFWANRTAIYDIQNGTRQIAKIESRENDLPPCEGSTYRHDMTGKYPPFCHLYHFAGGGKPWNNLTFQHTLKNQNTAQDNWWYWLSQANETQRLMLPRDLKVSMGSPLNLQNMLEQLLDPEAEIPVPMN